MNDQVVDPLVGTVIAGKYEIVKVLGEGGMGCVYLGEQLLGSTKRKVAVKTLHQHLSQDPQIRARFQREVGTVAELEHPNTIQVFDFGTTEEGLLYIVMEYVQGKSVADTLETEGPMSAERTMKILTQVVGSLEEAHKRGIIHRDLKPDNVVLCERAGQTDWVEVLDFGIAKRSTETDPNEAKLTQQGMVLGTPPYMSPEQFTGQPIGPQSDIYALAVMAYEMLTGALPFKANTAWEWASQHMTAQPSPFETQPNGALLPASMRQAIIRGLSKNPTDRFQSASEFLEAMKGNGAAAAAPISGGVARTEMAMPAAAPMDFGGGGTGTQQQPAQPPFTPGAPAHAAPHAAPAFVPAAPAGHQAGPQKKSNTGLLIGGGVGLLAVLGIGIAVASSGGSSNSDVPVPPPPSSTAPAENIAPVESTAPAATDEEPPSSDTGLTELSGAKTPPATPANNSGGGAAKPNTGGNKGSSSSSSGGSVPAPKPSGNATPAGNVQQYCLMAQRNASKSGPAYEMAKKRCLDGGGKL